MKIVEVTVSRSRKVNTGNYESKDYFISLKAEIEITDNLELITGDLFCQCTELIEKQISEERL